MNYQDISKLAEQASGKEKETLGKTAKEVLNEAVYNHIVSGAYLSELEKIGKRGEGIGVGGPLQGDFGADKCKCPSCGHTMAHTKGTPCQDTACPECGTKMKGVMAKTAEMEKLSEAEVLSAMTYDAIVEVAYNDEMTKIAEMIEKEAISPEAAMLAGSAALAAGISIPAYYLGKKRGKKGKYPTAWGSYLGGPFYTAGERAGLKETHKIVKKSTEDNTDLTKKADDLKTKLGAYLDTNKEEGKVTLASLIQKNKEGK